MPFAYETVEIDGKSYKVLASIAFADEYLAADPNALAWAAGDPKAKAQWLVQATRIFGRQSWRGQQLDLLAFPRSNVPNAPADAIPLAIEQATAELASAIAGGYDAAGQATTASGIKRQKAGSVEIEYFFATGPAGDGSGMRFPLPVWELVSQFLSSAGSITIGGAISSGTCAPSEFEQDFGISLGAGAAGSNPYDRECG